MTWFIVQMALWHSIDSTVGSQNPRIEFLKHDTAYMTLAEGTKKGHICYQMSKINVAARLFATAKKIDNFVFSFCQCNKNNDLF